MYKTRLTILTIVSQTKQLTSYQGQLDQETVQLSSPKQNEYSANVT